jgi:hypothetical protein
VESLLLAIGDILHIRRSLVVSGLCLLITSSASVAQDVALYLFDFEIRDKFVGCLNCSRYDASSVCNRYGDYGSRYSDTSIWNRYGTYGSRYEDSSPWNRYAEGLIIVDPDGNFYGQFSRNAYARYGQSNVPLVQALLRLHEDGLELDEIRDLLCD